MAVLEAEAHPSIRALKTEQARMLEDPDLAWRFIQRRNPDYADQLTASSPIITLTFD